MSDDPPAVPIQLDRDMTTEHDESEPKSDPTVITTEQSNTPTVSVRERRFEIVAVLLLSLAALATAWAGYQASLWDGIQSSNYTLATAARTEAAQFRTEANQFKLADLSVFGSFVDATGSGDEDRAEFYRDRFRPEFKIAVEAWAALDPFNNPNAPATPFLMDEYQLAQDEAATALEARAEEFYLDGEDANNNSDVYTVATLLFAIVLFFAAISERFETPGVRVMLLSLAGVGLVAGMAVAFGQRITTG